MAIKISGTTVIDNSQNITNAGIVTATSFTGDGSQLTNLPGGGGNTLEATASGTLADGSKVIVNADGTVSVVAQSETTGPGTGSASVFESARIYQTSAVSIGSGKIVVGYSRKFKLLDTFIYDIRSFKVSWWVNFNSSTILY